MKAFYYFIIFLSFSFRVWGDLGLFFALDFYLFIFEFGGATIVIFYFISASHCFTLSMAIN
jgi:hypothetical protein